MQSRRRNGSAEDGGRGDLRLSAAQSGRASYELPDSPSDLVPSKDVPVMTAFFDRFVPGQDCARPLEPVRIGSIAWRTRA
jgi:hypothetical protein